MYLDLIWTFAVHTTLMFLFSHSRVVALYCCVLVLNSFRMFASCSECGATLMCQVQDSGTISAGPVALEDKI